MATLSGKLGQVKWSSSGSSGSTVLLDITQWTFTEEAVTTEYGSSATSGWKASVPGVLKGSGSFQFKYSEAASPAFPTAGTNCGLTLVLDSGGSNVNITMAAVIKNLKLTVDIDNGTVVSGTCDFNANGAVAFGAGF